MFSLQSLLIIFIMMLSATVALLIYTLFIVKNLNNDITAYLTVLGYVVAFVVWIYHFMCQRKLDIFKKNFQIKHIKKTIEHLDEDLHDMNYLLFKNINNSLSKEELLLFDLKYNYIKNTSICFSNQIQHYDTLEFTNLSLLNRLLIECLTSINNKNYLNFYDVTFNILEILEQMMSIYDINYPMKEIKKFEFN